MVGGVSGKMTDVPCSPHVRAFKMEDVTRKGKARTKEDSGNKILDTYQTSQSQPNLINSSSVRAVGV